MSKCKIIKMPKNIAGETISVTPLTVKYLEDVAKWRMEFDTPLLGDLVWLPNGVLDRITALSLNNGKIKWQGVHGVNETTVINHCGFFLGEGTRIFATTARFMLLFL